MSMWFDVHSLSLEQLEKLTVDQTIIDRFVERPKIAVGLARLRIELPEESFFSKQRCYNTANYFIHRFDLDDSDFYIGRLRFIYNTLNKDIKSLEKGKLLSRTELSSWLFEDGIKELLNLKILYPESWNSMLNDLKEIRDHLKKEMDTGGRDKYIFSSYIN